MLRPPPWATGLVIARLDRLARALHVQESVLQVAWRVGASVFTIDGGEVLQDDPDDPMRTFLRQVIGGVAQLERSLIAKRMRDGRRAKAEAGGTRSASTPLVTAALGRAAIAMLHQARTSKGL